MKATVLGCNGYGGMLLLRILASHPEIDTVIPSSRSLAGTAIETADPGLPHRYVADGTIAPTVLAPEEALGESTDVVFSALPHGASAEVCRSILGRVPVIDLSADFRFRDESRFQSAYGTPRPAPAFQDDAVYGLVEWYRHTVASASIIANPGCYPTATLLPLLPVVTANRVAGPIVVTAMSGITGAGKKAKVNTLFGERSENVNAYSPGTGHRHHAEIAEQVAVRIDGLSPRSTAEASASSDAGVPDQSQQILFTPHLVPVKQGMAVTTVVSTENPEAVGEALRERYEDEPFIELTGTRPPETREVRGTNSIRIGWRYERGAVILMSVIDNLWKGASGQAVQNMNVRFGFPETTGLLRTGDL